MYRVHCRHFIDGTRVVAGLALRQVGIIMNTCTARVRCVATFVHVYLYFIYFIDNNYVLFVYTHHSVQQPQPQHRQQRPAKEYSLLTGDGFMAVIRFQTHHSRKGYRILFFITMAKRHKTIFA